MPQPQQKRKILSRRITVRAADGSVSVHPLGIAQLTRHAGDGELWRLVSVTPFSEEIEGVEYYDFPVCLTETSPGLFRLDA